MKNLFFLVSTILYFFGAFAQPGTLDGDFDADGILSIDLFGANDLGYDVVQDTDGKLLVCGFGLNNGDHDWFVKRLLPDGSADNTFGLAGLVVIDRNSSSDQCWVMKLQDDGKILLGGSTQDNASGDLTVVRLETNGNMDANFGVNGFAIVDINLSYDHIYDIAIQPDGKIVTVGVTTAGPDVDIVVLRFNTDGTLDNSFSFDGKVITSVNNDDWARGIAVTADGKIVVAGSTQDVNLNTNTLLVRYNADGTLDNSFGINGKLETDLSTGVDEFYALTIDAGKIVATGASWNGTSTDILVARFNADGSLDNTFSFDGVVETDFSGNTDKGWDILVQPDDKILVGGDALDGSDKLALVRYNGDGTLDNSFGIGGKVTTVAGIDDRIQALLIQSDGKIVGAGFVNNSGVDAVVVRYISGINIGIGEVNAYIGLTLVYPNPIMNNSVTVEYELKSNETVSIDLFDLGGKHIMQLQSQMEQTVGSYQKTLSLPELSCGNYLLKLNTEKGFVSVKLTVN